MNVTILFNALNQGVFALLSSGMDLFLNGTIFV
jgi:hypothetical protein